MKFGFIAHINNQREKNMLKVLNQINGLSFMEDSAESKSEVYIDFINFSIRSKAGAEAEGKIVYLPWLPEDIIENSQEALEDIKKAALQLEEWGADIIGLGGYTAAIGKRGIQVQETLKKARVTTGNTFTASTSVDTLQYIIEKIDGDLTAMNTVIIGFPGSIALLMGKLLIEKGASLTMVGRRENVMAKKYFAEDEEGYNNIRFTTELDEALKDADVVLSATTTGDFIDQKALKPGCIVIDVGEPKDVKGGENERQDVLIADGGRFSVEDEVEFIGIPFNALFREGFFGCIGETVLIALEGNADYCSIGRILDSDKAKRLRQIGEKHGFIVNGLSCWKENVTDSEIYKIKAIVEKNGKARSTGDIYEKLKSISKEEVMDKYATYINSVLVAVNKSGDYDRLYVRAEGMHVWDSDGREYLDFVGGYGSVNIGHNHPAIIENMQKYSQAALPSILQVAPGYCAAMLGERLAGILPGNLNKIFFCNSGTEAVEGSLKIARLYTGREKYISTRNSFHGKSFGSLSVTGREKYQEKFRPLLSNVEFIDYNSTEGLEELLQNEDIAAMILEPVQGEGGIVVAKDGYIEECIRLCHKYGTLLIADEVQTGFGRTGRMFAMENWNVVPDILACAKSLGGGLIPIGAYATTDDIWNEAYGSQSRYLLHTSTFGGNSFCSSVGVASLDVIEDEKLPKNAEIMGEYLLSGIRKIANDYNFIKEVRGKGLLIGIEFDYTVSEGAAALVDMVRSMIPAEVKRIFGALSGEIVDSFKSFIDENVDNVEKYLAENFASQFSASLLNDEGIISIVTLNNPYVVRIEPPLIITHKEADRFLAAFKNVCEKNRQMDDIKKPEVV